MSIIPDDAPESPVEQKVIYEGYLISILLKGAVSLAETVLGIALLFISPSLFLSFTQWITAFIPAGGLIGAHLTSELASYTSATSHFLALYLLIRGAIKLVIIIALLKNKIWGYPALLVVMTGFLAYQFYQIATAGSLLVVGITLFDFVVMYFVWREWRIVRARANA